MTVRNLEALFRPETIAVVGAATAGDTAGGIVLRNLLGSGFEGQVMSVNSEQETHAGVPSYPDVGSLPAAPDLAVICTPPAAAPPLLAQLGERGTRAAVVLTAGLSRVDDESDASLQREMLVASEPHCLRILGPNSLGVLVPEIGLNASLAHLGARPGRLALVSQSRAVCTAVLDWADARGIGFSYFVSLGNSADVDVGDVLDYLSAESSTAAILLYLEAVDEPRKFMSAGRHAARNKPVIVIKAGRLDEGVPAAASLTGPLAEDDVYDAAFRRAGMLRVYQIQELFDAAETLARSRPAAGDRLLVVSNGRGPGLMAADAQVAGGGRLAELSGGTRQQLDAVLPAAWWGANPIDITCDAPGERYGDALRVLLSESEADGILVLHSPTATASSEGAARAVAETVAAVAPHRIVLTSWMGGEGAEPARRILRDAGVASYDSPGDAVNAFLHMVSYRNNQDQLMETPPSLPREFAPDSAAARAVIEKVLAAGREVLTAPESKEVLSAYGIPSVETRIAGDGEEAVEMAGEIGLPVALKVLSPDLIHKTDVGGVALDLETPKAVREAADALSRRLRVLRPDASLTGFVVQPMARRSGAVELIAGAATDRVFGPVLLFGRGGTAMEVIGDRAIGFPPLNMNLAHELVRRTRVSKLLGGYRGRPPADREAICRTLVQLSQLLVDLPGVIEVDVNPLLADESGVLALDARIRVARAAPSERLAIRPYPSELEETIALRSGGSLLLRPIRPEDEPAHRRFFERLEPEDLYFRFFSAVREPGHSQLARFTQIDYDREMAFIAYAPDQEEETLGVVRAIADADNKQAEFAIIVRSDVKGQGLGRVLLEKMIRYCRSRGTAELVGQALAENAPMLSLARKLGFRSQFNREAGLLDLSLSLVESGDRPSVPEAEHPDQ
jgi:acetyltransferase